MARAFDAGYRLGMPCPRVDCGGKVVADIDGTATCTLCARGEIVARPPTKKEAGDKRQEKPNITDYYTGVYAIGYEPG